MNKLMWILVAIGLAVTGCDRSSSESTASVAIENVIRTASPPVDWMARRIAGDLVPVETLCPESAHPATWRPSPEIVARFQQARLIVVNGAEYERWALTAPLPSSRVVRTADAIDGPLLVVTGETHSHGPEGAHAHDEIDGHTWLDPVNAIAQAGAITEAMAKAFPEHAGAFATNHADLTAELQNLHARLEAIDTSDVQIIASESPFGYLARRYGWATGRIGGDPTQWAMELDAATWAPTLGDRAVLLCETLPDDTTAIALLESHGVHAVLWNTGELAGDASYAAVLMSNIERLEALMNELTS